MIRLTFRGWLADAAARRARRRAEREFASLDPRMLADLAVHRSEAASYWSESTGRADPTRRRLHARPSVRWFE